MLAFVYALDVCPHICQDVAMATGIILDPVYSGKALHYLLQDIGRAPAEWSGRRILFVHTGGLLVCPPVADVHVCTHDLERLVCNLNARL